MILVDSRLCVHKENCVSIQTPVSAKTSCVGGVPMETAIRNFLLQGSYREVGEKFKDFSRTSQDYFTVFKD